MIFVGLSSCGVDAIVGVLPPPIIPAYINLNDTMTGGDSTLGGKALIVGATSSATVTIRNVSGVLTHDSRKLTGFTDGSSTLTDSDGDEAGDWTDGITTVSANTELFGGSYNFADGFNILNTANGSGPMIVGVSSYFSSIPSTGSATFTGDAFIQGATLGDGGESINSTGVSTIIANFGANPNVSATINNIDSPSFDEIIISNIPIVGDGISFSGGTLQIFNDGVEATNAVLGSSQSFDNQGNFFGGNSTGTEPAEAGGVFVMSGSDANISGGYIGK